MRRRLTDRSSVARTAEQRPRLYALVCLAVTAVGCGSTPTASLDASVVSAYLERALDIMQQNSVNRYKIDWPPLRARAVERASGATTTAGTYSAIRLALEELGDNHSFFVGPSAPPSGETAAVSGPLPNGQRLTNMVGYVMIPWFSTLFGEDPEPFADLLHGIIATVDTIGMCGWIVDLRGNSGGNMWPMLAGVGPVLGEGIVGAFVDPDSVAIEWYYRNGASGLEPNNDLLRVTDPPYELILPLPTVAVLTGPVTASSGEAIVTAFRGRNATRSYGLGTAGLSTANRTFSLSDGARMFLTVSTFADRTGMLYGGVMEPDSVVTGWDTLIPTVSDNVVQVAADWITSEGDCVVAGGN